MKAEWWIRLALLFAVASQGARGDPPRDAFVTSLDLESRLTASYGVGPGFFDVPTGETGPFGTATTNVGGFTFDVNGLVGANRYYDHTIPITGQNSITTNLEAGHFWNGHETLQHVATTTTNFVAGAESWGGESISAKYDRHATWAAMLIGGRQTVGDGIYQQGIAPGTQLRSAALASEWLGNAYATGFDFTLESFLIPYQATFGAVDVVNSSWGFGGDSAGVNQLTVVMDAYAYQSPGTTYVVSAGNFGAAGPDTVTSPGSGYNAITVAALGGANAFDTVAGFSSRGPTDFGYLPGGTSPAVVVDGVRAAVDIAAPGTSLMSAFYGGQTGGNNPTLTNSVDSGSSPDAYSVVQGTSFSAPIVAGGAALVASAAKTLPSLSSNPAATQSVVVKALLLNGADKTSGWDNGQQQVTVGSDTFIRTTQSLDWDVGAGRMNLDTTFDLQVNGQTDLAGTLTGALGPVVKSGWDYGNSLVGAANEYVISEWLRGGTTFTASLAWMRSRFFNFDLLQYADVAQADLNLSVWELDGSDQFTTLVARSESLYNTVEHLSFTLPRSGFYGLRVEYPLNTFDNTTGDVWGTASFPQDYGLSWQAVPEPVGVFFVAAAAGLWPFVRRGRSTRRS